MGQKVNPLGFRVGITRKHRSQWFVKDREYSQLAVEDIFLRKFILSTFFDAGIIDITIKRKLDQIQLEMRIARSGVIVGPDGSKLKQVRQILETQLKKFRKKKIYFYRPAKQAEFFEKPQIALHVIKVAKPNIEATFIADFMVEQIQKRIPFRRAMRQALQRVQRGSIKGIKIKISGRLNGAEIARSEWIRDGRVPLQTLRANIDYSYQIAKTIYGIIGIKVWICHGDFNKTAKKI